MIRVAARFPILIAIGLGIGLIMGLALAHFFWIAALIIALFAAADLVRRRRV